MSSQDRPFAVEQPHHDLLAPDGPHRGDADVDVAAIDVERDLAVLGTLLLDDVEVGEDLDPADEARRQVGRQFGDFAQDPIDPGSDPKAGRVGLEVQVAGAVA